MRRSPTQLGISSTHSVRAPSRPVIRGLGGYRVQTLQDGLASLDVAGLSQDHAVTVESVVSEQIKVIKGPAALLYGSGAAGGLVNVVTNRVPMERAEEPISGARRAARRHRGRGAHRRDRSRRRVWRVRLPRPWLPSRDR